MSEDLRLDDPRRAARDLAESLRTRVAAVLGTSAEDILLAPTPASGRIIGLDRDPDWTSSAENGVCAFADVTDPSKRALECALSTSALSAALDALLPAGRAAQAAALKRQRESLSASAELLCGWPCVKSAEASADRIVIAATDKSALRCQLAAAGITAAEEGGEDFTLFCPTPGLADALASRLAVPAAREAALRRTTKETDIAVSVDLDRDGPVRASTGIEFFDHMLDQVGRHGGFALDVTAEGDVEVDAHHTIEDVCLTLGDALRQALGEKRGIARFGFELPMDETRAGVWIDLSGRPYAKFEGEIPGERVAGFPVEMTPHAFRSLAEAMKASIHVRVEGENAHHMIEACFKAFGRALRQALRVEGDAIPSTKGAL